MKKIKYIVVYYHPEYWRVQSTGVFNSKEALNKKCCELGMKGKCIKAIANTGDVESLLKLGTVCNSEAVYKVINKLGGEV